MSTKTLRKRIALVAVSALAAGLVSVAPANATLTAGDVEVVAKDNLINTGACAISSTAGALGGTFINGSDVKLTKDTGTDAIYLAISGPAVVVSATIADGSSASATVTPTTITDTTTIVGDLYNLRLTGIGVVTVTIAASSTAAATDVITINSVASCASSTFSAADSNVTIVTAKQADSDTTNTANTTDGGASWLTRFDGIDTASADLVANDGTGYIRAALRDGYSANLSEKAVIATGTGGCYVGLANTTSSTPSIATTSTTAVLSSTGADVVVAAKQVTSGTPSNCSVSISWNGVNVATKTFKFQGNAASVVVSDVTVGETGGYGYYRVTVKDANNNLLPSKTISASSSEANNAAALAIVSSAASTSATTSATAGAGYGKTPEVAVANDSTAGRFTCTSKGGSAKITVRTLVSGVTYVTSAPFAVSCGGALDTWSISLDKKTYAPGEIATLTVTGKDVDGFAVNSRVALGAAEYSFGGLTAVTAPTDADTFSSAAGTKTYKFAVGTSEGAFVGTFDINGTNDTSAKTVQYSVASAAGGTSNAAILKAIVSLIASINKQIALLQKALLKK